MKNIKITGIKRAIGEYKRWIAQDWRRTANIMLDKSTGEVWTDCFLDCNIWKEYHNSNIISLSEYICKRTEEPFTMTILRKYAEMAICQ